MLDLSKIHPNLAARLSAPVRAFAVAEPLSVIVKFRAEVLALAQMVLGVSTAQLTYHLIQAAAHQATPDAIRLLSQLPGIEMIWFDEPVHTHLDVSVPLIGAPLMWQAGFTGKGIKVGIVDTGIDPNHPDFAGRIGQIKDFTNEGLVDNHGHGTHVAGIIGGSGAASNGKYKGVAPECTFYPAKVLRGDGSGNSSDVMAGIEWAVQQGVQVINLSLGNEGACDGTDALSVLCDAAVRRGVAVCVAAGNSGPGASTVGSPGCAKTVITIGATTKGDQVAGFSSRGPTSDGRVKPDLCFPGSSIVSCRAAGTSMGMPVDNSYTSASGTSMATPHASGTCALLLQAKPGLTPQQIKDVLTATTKDLALDPNIQGKGRAQVFVAYQSLPTAPQPQPEPQPQPQPPTPTPTPIPAPGDGCASLVKSLLGGR